MYEKQKEKSSLRLIPDMSSCGEHVKRAWLQTNTWLQCMKRVISHADPMNYGWQQTEKGLKPIWFTCSQLPPSLQTKQRKRRKDRQNNDIEGWFYDSMSYFAGDNFRWLIFFVNQMFVIIITFLYRIIS